MIDGIRRIKIDDINEIVTLRKRILVDDLESQYPGYIERAENECIKQILTSLSDYVRIDATRYIETNEILIKASVRMIPKDIDVVTTNTNEEKVKVGQWEIDRVEELDSIGRVYEPVYRCSCCGRVTESYVRFEKPVMPEDADFPKYCQNCGAKMWWAKC